MKLIAMTLRLLSNTLIGKLGSRATGLFSFFGFYIRHYTINFQFILIIYQALHELKEGPPIDRNINIVI
jgi:hypothetical protein